MPPYHPAASVAWVCHPLRVHWDFVEGWTFEMEDKHMWEGLSVLPLSLLHSTTFFSKQLLNFCYTSCEHACLLIDYIFKLLWQITRASNLKSTKYVMGATRNLRKLTNSIRFLLSHLNHYLIVMKGVDIDESDYFQDDTLYVLD